MSRRRLDALLLLDKPSGMTSNGALQAAKRLYRAEKAGHAGTLDPLACGLLAVLFGEATKFAGLLLDSDKEYEAKVLLGVSTTTGDTDGEVTARRPVRVEAADLERALARFRGEFEQVPPMFSALKHEGRPLYELARRGAEVERAPRLVRVSALELRQRDGDLLTLRVHCSKGTYVRSLAIDLGETLGVGACVASLRRTASGRFSITDAVPLDVLAGLDDSGRDRLLRPLHTLLEGLPRVELDDASSSRFSHGQAVATLDSPAAGRSQVWDGHGRLLGLGERDSDRSIRPLRVLANPGDDVAKQHKSL